MLVIVMGVSGSGKTTVGVALAQALDCPFYDGDDFHPPANVAKMAVGISLDDDDRAGWLASLADVVRMNLGRNGDTVIACWALKHKYRAILQAPATDVGQIRFVFLKGDIETILARVQSRQDHYMKANMLQSQFDALEEPVDAITVDSALDLDVKLRLIMEQLASEKVAPPPSRYALDLIGPA